MPQIAKYKLPVKLDKETLGQRLARIRKERGFTQVELAKAIGITQVLVSDYERGKLRPHYEMIISFAQTLGVTTDEFLGLKEPKKDVKKPSLKIQRRLNKIEKLPPSQQRVLLKTIDTFLEAAGEK
ncbi:MAG: helix-turn-helix transcriptional regulator [Planctomycetota bacterium]